MLPTNSNLGTFAPRPTSVHPVDPVHLANTEKSSKRSPNRRGLSIHPRYNVLCTFLLSGFRVSVTVDMKLRERADGSMLQITHRTVGAATLHTPVRTVGSQCRGSINHTMFRSNYFTRVALSP